MPSNMEQQNSQDLSSQFDFINEQAHQNGSNTLGVPNLSQGKPADSFSLQNFWSSNQDPWALVNPAPAPAAPSQRSSQGLAPYYQNNFNFANYRNTNVSSDCGTLPADSGYGSHGNQYSIASTSSVHDDDGSLDPQLNEQFVQLGREQAAFVPGTQGNGDMKHFCRDCKLFLRTKSELNKHVQRHRKPHHCDYPNCPRGGEGFSTKNDLARHKKSVHGEHNSNMYVCREGQCAEKHKLWPRADNFRQHLTRVHQMELKADDDLTSFIQQSSPLREDLKGVGSSVEDVGRYHRPEYLPDSPDILPEHSHVPTYSYPEPAQVHSIPSVPSIPNDLPWSSYSTRPSISIQDVDRPILNDATEATSRYAFKPFTDFAGLVPHDYQQHLRLDETHSIASTDYHDVQGDTENLTAQSMTEELHAIGDFSDPAADDSSSNEEAIPEPGEVLVDAKDDEEKPVLELSSTTPHSPNEVLKYLQTLPTDLLESALKGRPGDPERLHSSEKSEVKAQNVCPQCAKPFNRPCELKKHMKRHEKPYGCTFRDCSKEFGSKNDWKRHESSQHFQLETWNCEEPDCAKVCHRREGFKNHLQRDHKLDDLKLIEEKLEKCRMGRHCDPRFWCGFCVKIIEVDEGVNSWTKRCDHIDNHLMGKDGLDKKQSIEWKYIEDQETNQPSPQSRPTLQTEFHDASTSAPKTSDAPRRRRRASPDTNSQPRKKSKAVSEVYMWTCHNCNDLHNHKTTSVCTSCEHNRCGHCISEVAPQRDEQLDGFDHGPIFDLS